MAVIQRQVSIGAAPEKVFQYLADFTRHCEWTAHDVKIEQTSPGAAGEGATFNSSNHMMGRQFTDTLSTIEFVPNEKIVYQATGKTGRFVHAFELKQDGSGTLLTKSVDPQKVSPAILAPILRVLVAPRALAGDLKRIKARLEA